MKRRNLLQAIFAACAMGVLILDGKTALLSAREGLALCAQSVIPSLFPFIVLSILLNTALSGSSSRILQLVGSVFRIPHGCEAILIPAFLGGYPVGAQAIGQAVTEGRLSREDGHRMLAYCSNAGPSFLFGMVGPILGKPVRCWLCWGILIFSVWITTRLFPAPKGNAIPQNRQSVSITKALSSAIAVILTICGWVVLFRILIAFFSRWFLWMLPDWASVLIAGLLELSNGCWALNTIQSEHLRFVLCCGMLSFGGLCVAMQTASVIGQIPSDYYLAGKTVQCILSILFGFAFIKGVWFVFPAVIFLVLLGEKMIKSSSIPRPVGV